MLIPPQRRLPPGTESSNGNAPAPRTVARGMHPLDGHHTREPLDLVVVRRRPPEVVKQRARGRAKLRRRFRGADVDAHRVI
jgi:hypothetical protein